jgi:hypothetical protein
LNCSNSTFGYVTDAMEETKEKAATKRSTKEFD